MNPVGKPERATRERVIALFRDRLGYAYLGDWSQRAGNRNIDEGLLTANLSKRGYSPAAISAAIHRLKGEADIKGRHLYGVNQAVYELLRFGAKVKTTADADTEIIWHTRGSGKSIVMVLLARWILENNPDARVLVVTDRDELDKRIEKVLKQAGAVPCTDKVRATSGLNLRVMLGKAAPRLICSLVHKFGRTDVDDFDAFIRELETRPGKTVGDIHVFADECHRTRSGRLHRAMKAMIPNAILIGFTGTPLLKKDKATTLEVFGRYIHTHKFTEAVEDEAKRWFTEQPARMKLLIVVDKLLTGFDAPSCTFLSIDKSMRDHGLFQAIRRTNRLDGEDKEFGHIVDYKDLFKKVEDAISVHSEELDHSAGGADPGVLAQERLKRGRQRLDDAVEHLELLCEPVEAPEGELEHIRYFCGNTEIADDLKEHEPQRTASTREWWP